MTEAAIGPEPGLAVPPAHRAGGRAAGRPGSAPDDPAAGPPGGEQRDAAPAGPVGRDEEQVARFVERFSAVLTEAGIPRMPSRVFTALLVADAGSLTAADLAARLQASPAAVSGGVRYLIQVGMIRRESEPGSRRHHYRIPDNVWQELMRMRDQLMLRWTAAMRDGIEILGAQTPAGRRMTESAQYFEFVVAELPRTIARWEEFKAASDGGSPGR